MIRYTLALCIAAMSYTGSVSATDCTVHPIYCHIRQVAPLADPKTAMLVSNLIYRATKHYGLDPHISVAIIAAESRFKDIAEVRHRNGRVDYGMVQVNKRTAEAYGLDEDLLQQDLSYQIWAHAVILKDKIKICKANGWAEGVEWSCYHSFNQKPRLKYVLAVRRFL